MLNSKFFPSCFYLLKLFLGLLLELKIYVNFFKGNHFLLGGRKSDDGIWSWSDGSAWSYENFMNEELRNRHNRLFMIHTKKWVGNHGAWNDNYNYLCQYTL